MPKEWRDTKKRDPEPAEMVAVRLPAHLKHRAQEIAESGNSTLAAAVRWGLEKFIEENDPAPKGELFD